MTMSRGSDVSDLLVAGLNQEQHSAYKAYHLREPLSGSRTDSMYGYMNVRSFEGFARFNQLFLAHSTRSSRSLRTFLCTLRPVTNRFWDQRSDYRGPSLVQARALPFPWRLLRWMTTKTLYACIFIRIRPLRPRVNSSFAYMDEDGNGTAECISTAHQELRPRPASRLAFSGVSPRVSPSNNRNVAA